MRFQRANNLSIRDTLDNSYILNDPSNRHYSQYLRENLPRDPRDRGPFLAREISLIIRDCVGDDEKLGKMITRFAEVVVEILKTANAIESNA